MRSAFLAAALALTLGAAAQAAAKSPYPQANTYFDVRDRAHVIENFSPELLQADLPKLAGKLIEIRGMVSAIAGAEGQTTVLLETAANGPMMVGLPPDKRLEDYAFLDVGTSIRALCKAVAIEGSGTGALEVQVAVKEYEAGYVDNARAKEAAQKEAQKKAEAQRKAAAARQKTAPQRMASRGTVAAPARGAAQAFNREYVLQRYTDAVRYFNRRLSPQQARRIAGTIIDYSIRYGLDARLVMAVIAVESNFNQHAVSPVGAQGLGQLMPGTAGDLGVGNSFDIEQNLEGSTRLLSRHIQNMSNGRPTDEAIKLALACYNAGAGAVKKYRGIPPYRETQNYVKKITRLYRQMCGLE
jgi:soluble lytic murein transglycosylase-like protein